jgi:hypothetical protein
VIGRQRGNDIELRGGTMRPGEVMRPVEKRFKQGGSVLAAYTWSKSVRKAVEALDRRIRKRGQAKKS